METYAFLKVRPEHGIRRFRRRTLCFHKNCDNACHKESVVKHALTRNSCRKITRQHSHSNTSQDVGHWTLTDANPHKDKDHRRKTRAKRAGKAKPPVKFLYHVRRPFPSKGTAFYFFNDKRSIRVF